MNDLNRCPEPDALVTLIYDDEGDPAERAALQAHLHDCRECADAYASLAAAHGTLESWAVPRLPLGFAIVSRQTPLWQRIAPWAGLAAAALLTLAGAAGLARLDIRYDAQGLRVRTGWASASPVSNPAPLSSAVATPAAAVQPDHDPRTAWVARASAGDPPWRADFELLATQLRAEFDSRSHAVEARLLEAATRQPASAAPVVAFDEDRLMQRIAERIDQGEVRQQQNLALRIAELGREFQLRRQADLVQFERGLARIENQRQDLIRRVAVTQAPQP